MTSPEEDKVMEEFKNYLTSIECGKKSLRDAKKIASVVTGTRYSSSICLFKTRFL